jgi:uncharacterized membrane-anchored protein
MSTMKLSTLRRSRTKALPGVTGVARVDRRTMALARRAGDQTIAIVDHVDMDRAAAVALVDAGVRAVVNAAPSISGRYPNLGPQHLLAAGVLVVDNVGSGIMSAVTEGDLVRIDGSDVYLGEDLVGSGVRQDTRSVAESMAGAREGIPTQLQALSANAVQHLRTERDLLLDGDGAPVLRTALTGRQVLVVVRAFDYARDLARLKAYIRDRSPVLLGVDGGADALIAAGLTPDVIVTTGEEISDSALMCGAELIVRAGRDGRVAHGERIERLGLRHVIFVTDCPTADAALLLAHHGDPDLIVAVGAPSGLAEFLDIGRTAMASSFLTQAAVGARVADAKAVAQLYSSRLRGWLVFLLVLIALVAVGAAIATTPVGQDWWHDLRGWVDSGYDWVRSRT